MRKFKVTFYEDSHSRNKLSEIVEAIDYDEAENKVLAMYGDYLIIDEIHDVFDTSLNDKRIYIDMPDGLTYVIPVMVIAEHRARTSAFQTGGDYYESMIRALKDFESDDKRIRDYARMQVKWEDVKYEAIILKRKQDIDYEFFWKSGQLEIK